ncbi:MAG: hypothetical protein PF444_01400 [Bacteroidales bacterium]|nr:hypothetical protein [Bacteroidales bacterium]
MKSGEELGFPASIYSDRTDLIIDLLLVAHETNVTVCDLTGKLLLREVLTGKKQHKFHFNGDNRILVVYLNNANGHLSKKVFLKR